MSKEITHLLGRINYYEDLTRDYNETLNRLLEDNNEFKKNVRPVSCRLILESFVDYVDKNSKDIVVNRGGYLNITESLINITDYINKVKNVDENNKYFIKKLGTKLFEECILETDDVNKHDLVNYIKRKISQLPELCRE
jgi:hypothetical protein